jgi:hypothetical protein
MFKQRGTVGDENLLLLWCENKKKSFCVGKKRKMDNILPRKKKRKRL